MKFHISQVVSNNLPYVKVDISKNFNKTAWDLIRNSIKKIQNSDFLDETKTSFTAEWYALLSILNDLKSFKDEYKFKVTYSDDARKLIAETLKNRNVVHSEVKIIDLEKNLDEKLKELGFTKLVLKDYQVRDLKRLLSFPHGANFSVQGSGKTAVTLAAHLLLRNNPIVKANCLFVVSPKNAFLAWEDGFHETLDDNCVLVKEGLTELTGTHNQILSKLNSGNRNFIINYEKLISVQNLISQFVLNKKNRIHFVLDESHKIKSELAQRSQAILSLSVLPFTRKDILTGTPLPNRLEDINSQYQFLYPGSVHSGNRFYVRTTKSELNLPEPKINFMNVEMSPPQLTMYNMVMEPLIRMFDSDSAINYSNYREIRKSVIRLIIISSNPIILTNRQLENGEFFFGNNIDSNIHRELVEEENSGGSPKIKAACAEARRLAAQGKKAVIWSYFRYNIETLGKYFLKDLNAEYIHGGVDVGSEEEYDTRKYKIKKFKDPKSDCMTLVANYASCAEGISLHKICHNAIYIDRSFQADQYLQSVDRICRLGNNDQKNISILQSAIPGHLRNIDLTVKNALERKISVMARFLNDPDLRRMADDESRGLLPIDDDITLEDIQEIIRDFIPTQ